MESMEIRIDGLKKVNDLLSKETAFVNGRLYETANSLLGGVAIESFKREYEESRKEMDKRIEEFNNHYNMVRDSINRNRGLM